MMKHTVRFIELGTKLKVLTELENLEIEVPLPIQGDSVWILGKQYRVVERHWNIGNMIGMMEIFVTELHPRSI